MIVESALAMIVWPEIVTRAAPEWIQRYSVWVTCQCREVVNVERGGRLMCVLVLGGVGKVKVDALGRGRVKDVR